MRGALLKGEKSVFQKYHLFYIQDNLVCRINPQCFAYLSSSMKFAENRIMLLTLWNEI